MVVTLSGQLNIRIKLYFPFYLHVYFNVFTTDFVFMNDYAVTKLNLLFIRKRSEALIFSAPLVR